MPFQAYASNNKAAPSRAQQKQHPRPQLDQTIGPWELCQDRWCMGGQQIGKETFDEGHH